LAHLTQSTLSNTLSLHDALPISQLKNAKQTLAEAYTERSGQSLEDVLAAMAAETWFTAEQALEFGLIDQVIDPVNLTNCLKALRDRKSTRLNSSHVKFSYAVFCL